MEFLKVCAITAVGVILILSIDKNQKQIGMVLGLVVCCVVIGASVGYLAPLISFLRYLEELSKIDHELIGIMLKIVGIGILTEITGLLCTDSGNASLGKALHIFGTTVILWLSIPLFRALLDLLQSLLGEI